jgi:hypothetical protein
MESTETQHATTEYTATQTGSVKEEFASRRRKQIIAAVPLIGALLLLIVFGESGSAEFLGISAVAWLPILLGIVLGGVIFSLYNWRCPGCNKYLGKSMNPKYCGKCGTQLS